MTCALLPASLALSLLSGSAPAERPARPHAVADVSAAYYVPPHDFRLIDSVFLNALVGVEIGRGSGLFVLTGLTATGAWGHIEQLDESFQDVRMDAAAAGLGGLVQARLALPAVGPLVMALEADAGVILYSGDFPPGGDIYNFALRYGGSLGWSLRPGLRVTVGYRWMHVSNGQGLGPHNPSYEGFGIPVGVVWDLRPPYPRAP